MFELPERIFLVHSTTADFHTPELNNLAASTKRGDVVLRCILSAISLPNNTQHDYGIWIFFNPTEHGIQRSLLFDKYAVIPKEIQNEVQLCKILQPLIVSEPIQTSNVDLEDFLNLEQNIKIFNRDLSVAIGLLAKKDYLFLMLDEQGTVHTDEEIEQLSKYKKKIVFILGDQIGISEDVKKFLDENRIEPMKISLGRVSYLTSQCITILRLLFK